MWIKNKDEIPLVWTIVLLALWSNTITCQSEADLDIEHVIVIGFDGLSPDGLEQANTPTFDRLVKEGAATMHARAVLPTSSSSNWASMIMGAGPEQHGITSNAWERDNFTLPAVTQGDDFLFPTIFRLVDQHVKNAEIGAIYHWGGFGRLFEKSAVDFDFNPETEDETAKQASTYIKEKKPDFTFIHFDHVDHAGHEFGHGTPEYYKAVEKADQLLKIVMEAVQASDTSGSSLVIVSADHGGLGKGHGGESLQEIEIPFLIWGKGVKKNYKINFPVYQYDNAATVAFAMGIKTPYAWIGKPVKLAFNGFDINDDYPILEQLKEPVIMPKATGYKKAGGLFDELVSVVVENPNAEGNVRYTLDGSLPTKNSELYQDAIRINKNTIVKAALFRNDKMSSMVAESFFRIKEKNAVKPVSCEIYYLTNLTFVPELENKKPAISTTNFEITSDEIKDKVKANTAVRFRTKLTIEKAATFDFFLRSDDGSTLYIDGTLVVDNDGDHGVQEKNGTIDLDVGMHSLEVFWFNGGGDGWLDVSIEGGGMPKQILPTTMLIPE